MSLRRLVKKVGKVVKGAVKVAAPIAATLVPGVGGVVAGLVANKIATKPSAEPIPLPMPTPGPTKAPTGRALGIATQVIGGLSDLARARRATTPQQATADVEPRILQARRRYSPRTRLLEGVAPEQFDAVTPLGEAQTAALPPRRTATSTGARNVSMFSAIASPIIGAIANRALERTTTSTPVATGGFAMRGVSSRALAPLPGAGFTTVGGFGTSASGAFVQFGRRRRRMNATNVHALRRALRRVESFVKLEKRVDKIVNRLSRSRGRANRSGFVRRK